MRNQRFISILALTVSTYSPLALYAIDDSRQVEQRPRKVLSNPQSVESSPRKTSLSLRKILSSPQEGGLSPRNPLALSKPLSPKEFEEKLKLLEEMRNQELKRLNRLLEEQDSLADYQKREAELKAQREARENLSRSFPSGATADKPTNVARLDISRVHSFAGRPSMTPDSLRRRGDTETQSARTVGTSWTPRSDPMSRVATSRNAGSSNKPTEDDPATKQAVEEAIRLSLTPRLDNSAIVDPLQKVIEESLTPRFSRTPRSDSMPRAATSRIALSFNKPEEDDPAVQEAILLSLTPDLTSTQSAQYIAGKPHEDEPATRKVKEEVVRLSLDDISDNPDQEDKKRAVRKEEKRSLIADILTLNSQVVDLLRKIKELKEKEESVSKYYLNSDLEKKEEEYQAYSNLLGQKENAKSTLFDLTREKNSRIQDYFLRQSKPAKNEYNQRRTQKEQQKRQLNDLRSQVINLYQKVVDKRKEQNDASAEYFRTPQGVEKSPAWDKYMELKNEESHLLEEFYQASALESTMAAQYFAFVQDKGAVLPINMANGDVFKEESRGREKQKEEKRSLIEQILHIHSQFIALRQELPELTKQELEAYNEYSPYIIDYDSENANRTRQKWMNVYNKKEEKKKELSQLIEQQNSLINTYFGFLGKKSKDIPSKDKERREQKEQWLAKLQDVHSQVTHLTQMVKEKREAADIACKVYSDIDLDKREEKDRAWKNYASLDSLREELQKKLEEAIAQESEMILEYFTFVRKEGVSGVN